MSGTRDKVVGMTFFNNWEGLVERHLQALLPCPHMTKGTHVPEQTGFRGTLREGCQMQSEAPPKERETEESDQTLQATSLGIGKDRQRSELGFVTGTDGSC